MGWYSNTVSSKMPKIVVKSIQSGLFIDSVITSTSVFVTDKLSKLAILIQNGEFYWNIFFLTLASAAISGVIYVINAGGIF